MVAINGLSAKMSLLNSRILTGIADVLREKIEEEVKGLKLSYGGKSENGAELKAFLSGEMVTDDYDETEDKVRSVVTQLLSNKTNVTDSLDGLR